MSYMYESKHQRAHHHTCVSSITKCILLVSSPSQNIHLTLMLLHAVIDFKLCHATHYVDAYLLL